MTSSESELKIVNVQSLSENIAEPGTSTQYTPVSVIRRTPTPDKPLLTLIKQLVNYLDNKEKTVVTTNAQLLEILQVEFHIEIECLHGLEVDIYMNVLKKFFKSWPKWDSIDLIVQKAKHDKTIDVEKILSDEYVELKGYLHKMLNLCKTPTSNAVKRLKKRQAIKPDAYLEVCCTKNQLYNLFLQCPKNGVLYNVTDSNMSTKINITPMSFTEIFNWPFLTITIEIGAFTYERMNSHEYKHILVNTVLGFKPPPPEISRDVLIQSKHKAASVDKTIMLNYVQIFKEKFNDTIYRDIIDYLAFQISDDLSLLEDNIHKAIQYKYYQSKFPYLRCFFNQTDAVSTEYNLELQEYVSPCVVFQLQRFDSLANHAFMLKIKCGLCSQTFAGLEGLVELKQHFLELHSDDKDLSCSHCGKMFSVLHLAANKWKHKC